MIKFQICQVWILYDSGLRTSLWYSAESVAVKKISFICVLYCIITLISILFCIQLHCSLFAHFCISSRIGVFESRWQQPGLFYLLINVEQLSCSFAENLEVELFLVSLHCAEFLYVLSFFQPIWKQAQLLRCFFSSLFYKMVNSDHYLKAI